MYFATALFSTLILTVTLLSFVIIYIGIIKGIPDIMNKIGGNIGLIIVIPLLIILSIGLLIASEKNDKLNIPAYIASGISFCFITIFYANKRISF